MIQDKKDEYVDDLSFRRRWERIVQGGRCSLPCDEDDYNGVMIFTMLKR